MSFIKTVAYDDNDAAFFVNNLKIGLVRSARESIKTEIYPLRCFGEAEPSEFANGSKSYEIVLKREQSGDAIDFAMYDEFTLRIKRANSIVVYDSCRCKSIEIERMAGEPMLEVITLTAAGRKEA